MKRTPEIVKFPISAPNTPLVRYYPRVRQGFRKSYRIYIECVRSCSMRRFDTIAYVIERSERTITPSFRHTCFLFDGKITSTVTVSRAFSMSYACYVELYYIHAYSSIRFVTACVDRRGMIIIETDDRTTEQDR